jgi:hypothetical protein
MSENEKKTVFQKNQKNISFFQSRKPKPIPTENRHFSKKTIPIPTDFKKSIPQGSDLSLVHQTHVLGKNPLKTRPAVKTQTWPWPWP